MAEQARELCDGLRAEARVDEGSALDPQGRSAAKAHAADAADAAPQASARTDFEVAAVLNVLSGDKVHASLRFTR